LNIFLIFKHLSTPLTHLYLFSKIRQSQSIFNLVVKSRYQSAITP